MADASNAVVWVELMCADSCHTGRRKLSSGRAQDSRPTTDSGAQKAGRRRHHDRECINLHAWCDSWRVQVCGGVIPPKDYDFLFNVGVSQIFGPGTRLPEAVQEMVTELDIRLVNANE